MLVCYYLFGSRVKDSDITYLTNLQLSNLTQLRLNNCSIDPKGIRSLIKKEWPKLFRLYLSGNNIGDTGMSLLVKGSHQFPALRSLQIYKNNIAFRALQIAPHDAQFSLFRYIKYLNLSQNAFGSRGVKMLNKVEFILLEELWLDNCEIGNMGAKHLAKTKWGSLKILRLSSNSIGVDGYHAIIQYEIEKVRRIVIWEIKGVSLMNLVASKLFHKVDIVHRTESVKQSAQFKKAINSRFSK